MVMAVLAVTAGMEGVTEVVTDTIHTAMAVMADIRKISITKTPKIIMK